MQKYFLFFFFLLLCIAAEKSMKEQQFEERKVFLERKLSRRPTVKELRERNILM